MISHSSDEPDQFQGGSRLPSESLPSGGPNEFEPEHLPNLEERIGYHFTDRDLLRRNLVHASMRDQGTEITFDRSAVLGGSIFELEVRRILYMNFPEELEGELTKRRNGLAEVTSKDCLLYQVGLELELPRLITAETKTIPYELSPLTGAVLVFFASVHSDARDAESAFDVVRRVCGDRIVKAAPRENPKSALTQFARAHGCSSPTYETIEEQGPPHDRTFVVSAGVEGFPSEIAAARTKRAAQEEAARRFLERRAQDLQKDMSNT